jgi:hypothetical protein
MKNLLKCTWLVIWLFSCEEKRERSENIESGEVKVAWKENFSGDFSFKDNWSYPEGVYKNEFGQLSCDGLCPPEIDRMKAKNGMIIKDSLKAFYQLVDTTHQFYSTQSDAWCYEWAGTNFAVAKKINEDKVICFTQNNAGTHSSLNLIILKNKCIPTIKLNSVSFPNETKTYTFKSGKIEIDNNLWNKGILKANFDFIFNHPEDPTKSMFWKGKIYTKIEGIKI